MPTQNSINTLNIEIMKTSFLEWNEYLSFLDNLKGNKFRVLFALQGMLGLRIGDVLQLKWGDVINKKEIIVIEQKTKKKRVLYLSDTLVTIINEEYKDQYTDVYIFKNKFSNTPMTDEYVNRKLKLLFKSYNIEYCGKISSHLFRKTFGRRYMDINDWSDKALMMLNKVYRHTTLETTKIYLGINEEEVKDVYYSLI